MMYYWPVSAFMQNPDLPPASKWELSRVGQPGAVLTEATMVMCHRIAGQVPASGTLLVLIHNEGTPTRRAYLARPSYKDWEALERGGFVATENQGFGFTMDALH